MSRTCKAFPPPTLTDLGRASAGNFLSLVRAGRNRDVALALGAGVTAAVGGPRWSELLKAICGCFLSSMLDRNHGSRNPFKTRISIGGLPDNEMLEVTGLSKLAERLAGTDYLILAQQIQNCVREADWRYMIRRILYDKITRSAKSCIHTLATICREHRMIRAVVNYNYDDTLERHLEALGVPFATLTTARPHESRNVLPVYHPNGWLPQDGGQDASPILSESDYQGRSGTPYSWSNVTQLTILSSLTTVFVGLSLTDPHLRSLLRATRECANVPHYAFLPAPSDVNDESTVATMLFDNDLNSIGIRVIRYPAGDNHRRLWSLICQLHHAWQNKETLWTGANTDDGVL